MTRISRNRTYRNDAMIDLDMHVIHIEYTAPDEFWLSVWYVYRRNPKMVIGPDRVRLKHSDIPRWREI